VQQGIPVNPQQAPVEPLQVAPVFHRDAHCGSELQAGLHARRMGSQTYPLRQEPLFWQGCKQTDVPPGCAATLPAQMSPGVEQLMKLALLK
jgi:hypothetical protein